MQVAQWAATDTAVNLSIVCLTTCKIDMILLTCLTQLDRGLIFNQALVKHLELVVWKMHQEAKYFYYNILYYVPRVIHSEWHQCCRNNIKKKRYQEAKEMYWDGEQTLWQSRVPLSLWIIHVEQLVNAFLKTCCHRPSPLSWPQVLNKFNPRSRTGQWSWRHFYNNQSGAVVTIQISWLWERQ